MQSKRASPYPQNDPSSLPIRLGITQIASDDRTFAVLLKGQFYLLEDWQGDKTAWMAQAGECIIVCPFPEALVKLSFFVVPCERGSSAPLRLSIKQGNLGLFEQEIASPEQLEIFISLIEGQNPISFCALGELLSPFEISGSSDARKLSFAFQKFNVTRLS